MPITTVGPATLVKADCIDWNITDPDFDLDKEAYDSTTDASLQQKNAGHSSVDYKAGKYRKNCDPNFQTTTPPTPPTKWSSDIHEKSCYFKISINAHNQPLIGSGNFVAAPCPPFCSTARPASK